MLGILDNLDKIIAAASGGAGTAGAAALYALIRGRRLKKQRLSLEESVRKELWDEIGNLRAAIREANGILMEWQSRYLTLLTSHQKLAEDLVQEQKNITKLSNLLSDAMTSLDRIEEVERHVAGDSPDLLKAKQEIDVMKLEASAIRKSAASLVQV